MQLVHFHRRRHPHHRSHPTRILSPASLFVALAGFLLLFGKSTRAGITQPEQVFDELPRISNEFDLDSPHHHPLSPLDLVWPSEGVEPDQTYREVRQYPNEQQPHSYATNLYGWRPNIAASSSRVAPSGNGRVTRSMHRSVVGTTSAQRSSEAGEPRVGSVRARRTASLHSIYQRTEDASRYDLIVKTFQELYWQANHPNIFSVTALESDKVFADPERSYRKLVSPIPAESNPEAQHAQYRSDEIFLPMKQQPETQQIVNWGLDIGDYTYVRASKLEREFVLQKFLDDVSSAASHPDPLAASHPGLDTDAVPGIRLIDNERPWAKWQDWVADENLADGIATTTSLNPAVRATQHRGPMSSYSINGYSILFRHLKLDTDRHAYQVTAVPTKSGSAKVVFSYSLGYLTTNVDTSKIENNRGYDRPMHYSLPSLARTPGRAP